MSIYGKRKENLFLGYFTDLTELNARHPEGVDGAFAAVNDVKKKYYWDVSSRSWEDSGDKYNGDFTGTVDLGNVGLLKANDERFNPSTEEKQDDIITAINNSQPAVYATRIVETGNYTYIGLAAPGSAESSAVWRIYRIDETTDFGTEFADGNSNFDNVWDDGAGTDYSDLSYS